MRSVDPASVYEAVGGFEPGRFTIVYQPVELYDEAGERLHDAVPRADRKTLIEHDRRFIFEIRDTPLKGLGDQVNLLLRKTPVKVTLDAAAIATLGKGAKGSDVVDVWPAHNELTALVEAHPDWFGGDPQAVYQIPHAVRDQATWFRFDRAAKLGVAVMESWETKDWRAFSTFVGRTAAEQKGPKTPSASEAWDKALALTGPSRLLDAAFPKLRVPLVWHAVGAGGPGLVLKKMKGQDVPRSSVILFHELGHIAECRASDGYSEKSTDEYLKNHPREAAVVELLGRTLTSEDLAEGVEAHMPGPDVLRAETAKLCRAIPDGGGANVSSFLLRNRVSQRMVGKVLGEPNVLPDDQAIIDDVWMRIPAFRERLLTDEMDREPADGDVRIVRGGLYIGERAFARIQVFERGKWRNTYMADSGNPRAPVGPVLEACMTRLAKRIRRGAGR
jgi:hypothetical protein